MTTFSPKSLLKRSQSLVKYGYPVSTESKKWSKTLEHLDSINEPEWIEFEHEDFKLPATQRKGLNCGKWMYEGCLALKKHPNNMAYVKHFQYSCNKSSCSKCFIRWRDREANAIRVRIWEGRKKLKQLPIHTMISIPTWLYNKPIKEVKKESMILLKQAGMIGFSTIYHPARFDKKDGKLIPFFAPHFHVLGFGWIKNVGMIYKKKGYVIKNLGVRRTQGEVFATAQYELSHVGIKKKRHSVTWHGELSYAKLKLAKPLVSNKCPFCNDVLVRLIYTTPEIEPDEPLPDGEWGMLVEANGFRVSVKHR